MRELTIVKDAHAVVESVFWQLRLCVLEAGLHNVGIWEWHLVA